MSTKIAGNNESSLAPQHSRNGRTYSMGGIHELSTINQ